MTTSPGAETTPEVDLAEQASTERARLGQQAARGAVLTVGAQLVKIVVQVAGVVVLARLLTPGDYGLVAMVTSLVGVAEIFRDFGLSAAAVQVRHLSRAQRDNLFWINTAAGAVLTVLVVAIAPLVANWYGRHELVDLTRIIALVFLLNGMTAQYRADLNRHLRFAKTAILDVLAPLVALGLAIGLALAGAGYWALVVQQLTAALLLLVGAAVFSRWLPRLPRRHESMGGLMTFGWQLTSSQLIAYLGNNVDSLTIGYRFGASPLGLYNRAFQLLMTPLGQLRQPTTTVALPVLSRLREDAKSSDRFVQRGQLALGLTLGAGLGLIIGAASPVTSIFLGPQWSDVTPILRLLATAGIFQTLAFVGYWIYLSHGLTKQLLQYTLISVTVKVACVIIGSNWGVVGVACGYAIAPALTWPLSFWWLSRKSFISVRGLFAGAARILPLIAVIAAASFGACSALSERSSWIQLGAALSSAIAAYGLALLLPVFRRDVRDVLDIVRQGAARRL